MLRVQSPLETKVTELFWFWIWSNALNPSIVSQENGIISTLLVDNHFFTHSLQPLFARTDAGRFIVVFHEA